MNESVMFVKQVIKTKGNCTDLDCAKCPLRRGCAGSEETKQATLIKARYWLSEHELVKK